MIGHAKLRSESSVLFPVFASIVSTSYCKLSVCYDLVYLKEFAYWLMEDTSCISVLFFIYISFFGQLYIAPFLYWLDIFL